MHRFVFVLVTFSLLVACGSDTDPSDEMPVLPTFARVPDAPVIEGGRPGQPSFVIDPFVLADAEGYHLFFTAIFCRNEMDIPHYYWDPGCVNLATVFGAPAYAFSSDLGLTWEYRITPVAAPAQDQNAWNSNKLETPAVARIGDTLYLLFSADSLLTTQRFQIGAAVLTLAGRSIREALLDDTTQFVQRNAPLISYSDVLEDGMTGVQEPSAVVVDGKLAVFFIALGNDVPGGAIRLMRQDFSADLSPLSSPERLLDEVNIQEVRHFDGVFNLYSTMDFRDGEEFHGGESIGYAQSSDGYMWRSPNRILERRAGKFDSWGIMAPTVIDDQGLRILFYTAFEASDQDCDSVVRVGHQLNEVASDGTRCIYTALGRAVQQQ